MRPVRAQDFRVLTLYRLVAPAGELALAVRRRVPPHRVAVVLDQPAHDVDRGDEPDDPAVRQLVRRARATLAELGADEVIGAAPGRGYFLAWPIERG